MSAEIRRTDSTASLDEHQRSQDAHLAHSMNVGNAAIRTRSNTLLDQNEMMTPQRERGGGSGGGTGQSRERGGSSPPRESGSGRRRGSVGAINPLDHLADDIEIHAHQQAAQAQRDQVFFDRGAASTADRLNPDARQRGFTPHSVHTPSSLQHSAAAARFYRQQRNLSESSIDSQGGAYIDHRRQPHSLSIGTSGGRLDRGGGGGGGGSSNPLVRSPVEYRSGGGRRQTSSGNVNGNDDGRAPNGEHELYRQRSISPPSPSNRGRPGGDDDPSMSAVSTRTLRQQQQQQLQQQQQQHFSSADLDENAIITDESDHGGRQSPREHLERHASSTSYASAHSAARGELNLAPGDERNGSFSNELSRQGSLIGQPEEDVCFPAHGASADVDLLDLGMSTMYGLGQHTHRHSHHQQPGVAGVLHNFPFPFDFDALEEYAEREKDGIPIPPNGARRTTTGDSGISPPGYGTSQRTATMGGLSAGSSEGMARRTMRQRKLSESVAPGRYQPKLALFEGTSGLMGGGRGSGTFDTTTPLLADKNAGGGGGGGYGTSGRGGGTSASGAARPYRFSFYSNSLPSTIHARSLAEIPAEGQTFEDLFVGHKTTGTDDDESSPSMDPRTGTFSPASHPGTGSNTPNLAEANASRTSMNGARPAGVPLAGLGNSRGDRPRASMMRTEVDAEANTWWLDIMCPTDAEMKVLSKVFGIHPLTTEDILMEETREKIELFRNYYFVCFRSFEQDPYSPTYLEPLNMYIIVFREGTLSFHFRGTPHPQNVRRRIKQLKDYINVTSDWISYALIDDITDAFGPLIQNIEYEVDSIDELVLILKEAEQSDMLRRIGTCRKKVMGLLRLMGNKADVVKGLSKRCNENWAVAPKSDIGLYLSDIQDHITTSTQNLTHYEKILSRSHSNYLAQISIEMTDANNQINDVLSKLTALGTVLIPMNLVTGLWGMNVHVPGQEVENLHWFFSIIGCLGCIALGGAWLTYRVFVRQ
ncbi:hypothetical protein RQP46_002015 [Phenoliferia psychrophenolica]